MTSDLGDTDPRTADDPSAAPDGATRPRRGSPLLVTLALGGVAVAAVLVGALVASALVDDDAPPADDAAGTTADAPPRLDAGPRTGREQRPLPEVTLEGFADGAPVDLTSYRGSPLLVNFWATWCAPCVEEMPDIQEVADALGDRVAVLGVNVQDAPANAEAFVDELDVGYDLAVDPSGELYADVRGFGMPTTLLVDAEGTIVYRHTGPLDDRELGDLVAEHLGVEPAADAQADPAGAP